RSLSSAPAPRRTGDFAALAERLGSRLADADFASLRRHDDARRCPAWSRSSEHEAAAGAETQSDSRLNRAPPRRGRPRTRYAAGVLSVAPGARSTRSRLGPENFAGPNYHPQRLHGG